MDGTIEETEVINRARLDDTAQQPVQSRSPDAIE